MEHDRHVEGLFSRAVWLRLLSEVGFEPRVVPFDHSELEPGSYEVFVATKRDEDCTRVHTRFTEGSPTVTWSEPSELVGSG